VPKSLFYYNTATTTSHPPSSSFSYTPRHITAQSTLLIREVEVLV